MVPCDKGIIRSILKRLIDQKIDTSERKIRATTRWSACLKKWWLRGLKPDDEKDFEDDDFKNESLRT